MAEKVSRTRGGKTLPPKGVTHLNELRLPPDPDTLRALRAGEHVLLTGDVLTMRDAALARLDELVEKGVEIPFDLQGQVVFHAGPTPPAAGRPAGAIGPTTSARMDHYLAMLFDLGVLATLGKGPRSEDARALHESRGSVYLAAIGGLAALYGGMVEEVEPVAWEDLGPEAVYRVTLKRFPALVAIDTSGSDYLLSQHVNYRRDQE
jgi:fumarate hydratase subunit beta